MHYMIVVSLEMSDNPYFILNSSFYHTPSKSGKLQLIISN